MNQLCECGCGDRVKSKTARFIRGHSNRSLEIKAKKKESYRLHYGVEHPMHIQDVKDKVRDTTIKNHGAIGYASDELMQKSKDKTLERYGVEFASQSNEFQDKVKVTCLGRYGVESWHQSEEIKEKKRKTCLKHYGVDSPLRSKIIQEKTKATCLKKYGVDNPSKDPVIVQKIRLKTLQRIEDQLLNGEPLMPCIGTDERNCLNELDSHTKYTILKNDPMVCREIRRYPDGYIKKLNLIIEFDERHHFIDEWETLNEKDIQRQTEIAEYLNCRFFRIKQHDWLNDPEKVIQEFKEVILLSQSESHRLAR